MEFYIKTLGFLERVMNGVMAIDPGQQPFISRDLEELNEMRDSLLKASGQAERSHEAKAALPLQSVTNRALWRIEPYFDGISTAVTTYKVVDQNGTLQYMGDRSQCEYFVQHGG